LAFSAQIFSVSALQLSFSAPPPEVVLSIGIRMHVFLATFVRFGTIYVCFGTAPKIPTINSTRCRVIIYCEILPTLFLDALLSSAIHFSDLRLFIPKVYLLFIMERPTSSRKQPIRLADFEACADEAGCAGRVLRDRGRRGGFDRGVDVEVSGDSERVNSKLISQILKYINEYYRFKKSISYRHANSWDMQVSVNMTCNIIVCFCAETDTVGAEKDTIGAETDV
jgi:hypothetical protein